MSLPVGEIVCQRVWAMPSKWTFTVPVIAELLRAEMQGEPWADPFCGFNSPAQITNDLEPDRPALYHLDGLEFLRGLEPDSLAGVLFDPPYSVEQCLRLYTPRQGGTAGRSEYWARCMDAIAVAVRPGGKAISFGWNSCGMGGVRGFEIERVLLVCHGACHNDTIVTVDRRCAQRGLFCTQEAQHD